jgi:hypothetical protein
MADENTILSSEAELVRQLQGTIRRQLDQRGIALKAISFDSGIGYSTLLTYFPAANSLVPASAIPMTAVRRLVGVIPADLLSLLLPDGWQIVRAPEAIDHDALSEHLVDYLAAKQAAHHPESEAGPAIGPNERQALDGKVVQITAVAA